MLYQNFTRTCEKVVCATSPTNSVSQLNLQTHKHKHSSHPTCITTCWTPSWISNYHCTLTQNLLYAYNDGRPVIILVTNFCYDTTTVRLQKPWYSKRPTASSGSPSGQSTMSRDKNSTTRRQTITDVHVCWTLWHGSSRDEPSIKSWTVLVRYAYQRFITASDRQ
jgi:hypothetical protein